MNSENTELVHSVDDYLDEFWELISDSGYTDPRNIIVKFRRGLDRRISQAIVGMTQGRPTDVDLDSWYDLAVQIDQNRAADKAFMASYRSPPMFGNPQTQAAPRGGMVTVPRPPPPPHCFAHAAPTPGNPVPMDIDAARKKAALPQGCRRCGQLGHWAKDCPQRFDVRHMSADEVQDVLEAMLAKLDVAPPEEAVAEPAEEEDFVPCSE